MWNFPLFPDQASTLAGRVDAVFFYGSAISLFFTVADLRPDPVLRDQVPPRLAGDRAQPGHAQHAARDLLDRRPAADRDGDVLLRRRYVYFHHVPGPRDAWRSTSWASSGCGRLQHPEGQREINELHVPVGQPVRLTMTSEDVIHSFFVPAFRIKQDVLPGPLHLDCGSRPTKPGDVPPVLRRVLRHEHSGMIGRVVVMEPADYQHWLAERRRPSESLAAAGRAAVHAATAAAAATAPNATVRAPLLDGRLRPAGAAAGRRRSSWPTSATSATRSCCPSRRSWPGYEPVMPTFEGQISEEELLKLIAYIKSLGQRWRVDAMSATSDACRHGPTPPGRELPERRLRRLVVAADDRPQADRASCTWSRSRSSSSSAALAATLMRLELMTPAGRPGPARDLQQAVHAPRRDHGLLLPDPVDPGGAGQLPGPADDRRAGPGLPELNLLSWYLYMLGGAVRAVRRCSRAASTPAGRSTRPTAACTRNTHVHADGGRASSSPGSRRSSPG